MKNGRRVGDRPLDPRHPPLDPAAGVEDAVPGARLEPGARADRVEVGGAERDGDEAVARGGAEPIQRPIGLRSASSGSRIPNSSM